MTTVVNRALPSLHEGLLKFPLTVPLRVVLYVLGSHCGLLDLQEGNSFYCFPHNQFCWLLLLPLFLLLLLNILGTQLFLKMNFLYQCQPTKLEKYNQAVNIRVVLPNSLIKIWGKSSKGWSVIQTNRHPD